MANGKENIFNIKLLTHSRLETDLVNSQ